MTNRQARRERKRWPYSDSAMAFFGSHTICILILLNRLELFCAFRSSVKVVDCLVVSDYIFGGVRWAQFYEWLLSLMIFRSERPA